MKALALLPLLALAAVAQPIPPAGKPSTALAPGVERHENLRYAQYGRRVLTLDLFTPEKDGTYPGVLVVHGGGWQNGDKTKFRAMCQQLALHGYVAACVGYRLSNEARFPGALHDLKAAVRWMRAQASKYKIDPARIAALGGSAGGHLVGLLATTSQLERFEGEGGNPEQSSAIQAAVVLGGGMDYVTPFLEDPDRPAPNMLLFFGGTYQEMSEFYADASAVTHVDEHTPPFLFLDGEFDLPGERYVTTRKKLDALEIPNEFVVMKGGKHGCWNNEPWFTPMIADVVDFFDRRL